MKEIKVDPKPHKHQQSTLKKGQERLEKVMAHLGLASRREAKDLITKGLVKVNNEVIKVSGYGIDQKKDKIIIAGQFSKKEAVLIYKPRNIETTKTSQSNKDIHDQFKKINHLFPIGRLDKDSEGLIIMSNDGTLTKALTKLDSKVGKKYLVTVRENISDNCIMKMSQGIMLDGTMTKPAKVARKSRTSFEITLYEGRKHQIRRMCDACRLTIESLVRIGIGHLKIDGMLPGNVRKLSVEDVELLKN